MDVIRTLLVDDHLLFAETLAARLGREPDLEILPVAEDETRARTLLRELDPSVVLLDEIEADHPDCRVVVLTGVSATDQVVEAVRRGARAWLPKAVDGDHVVRVIRGVFRGESWIPPDLLGHVLRELTAAPSAGPPDPLSALTARERDVLQCAVNGL